MPDPRPDPRTEYHSIPRAGSYAHVLMHPRITSDFQITEHGYQVTLSSRRVEWRGEKRHLMFAPDELARLWLFRKGWTDITAEWFAHLAEQEKAATPEPAPSPEPEPHRGPGRPRKS